MPFVYRARFDTHAECEQAIIRYKQTHPEHADYDTDIVKRDYEYGYVAFVVTEFCDWCRQHAKQVKEVQVQYSQGFVVYHHACHPCYKALREKYELPEQLKLDI